MSLAGSRGATEALRLALCSFQYSRQCRSWEWMKRHMSQAWAAHTSSSTQSLQRAERGSGRWAHSPGQGLPRSGTLPGPVAHRSPQPGRPAPPGGHRAPAYLRASTLRGGDGCTGLGRRGRRQRQTRSHTVLTPGGTHGLSLLHPQHRTQLIQLHINWKDSNELGYSRNNSRVASYLA